MKKRYLSAALAAIGAVAPMPSNATVLLDLVNPPGAEGTGYNLVFVATASETKLSVGGYQIPAYEYVEYNSVATGGGSNLLGSTWTLEPASIGSDAFTFYDGTAVPALSFAAGSYVNDTFSQTFATTPGTTYTYSFTYFNNEVEPVPSALLVATTASVVPEISTWVMMALGFVGLCFAGYRAPRRSAAAA